MKAITSLIVLLCIMAACSPDSTKEELSTSTQTFSRKNGSVEPNNPENANDHIGTVYQSLLDAYYNAPLYKPSLSQIIAQGETLALQNPGFLSLLNDEVYITPSQSEITPYLETQETEIANLLSSSYGTATQNLFTSIVGELNALKISDATYSQVYTSLIYYEDQAMTNPDIGEEELSGFLTTTAILRNALYHDGKRKRRDRDWEWMIGNIAATANSALESKPQAIMMSFATDVYQQ